DERLRDDKKKLFEEHIEKVVEDVGLEQKYALQIEIKDSWLNKSSSVNQIKETIEFIANNLLTEQQLDISNRENVKSYVKLKNEEHDINLSVVSYLSQLEFGDVYEVKKTIDNHVETELEARKKELEEIVRKEQEAIDREKEIVNEVVEEKTSNEKIVFSPFVDNKPVNKDTLDTLNEHSFLEVYHVRGTMSEQNLLVKFMEDNGIEYEIEMEIPF